MGRNYSIEDRGRPAAFQDHAVRLIGEVLVKRGVDSEFKVQNEARYVEFEWKEKRYLLAVFAGEVNMREGANLYECYLREEFEAEDVYIRSFCSRLDRFLQDGRWGAPQERASSSR